MNIFQKILLSASIIVWIICNSTWIYFDESVYYIGIAQMIFVASFVIHSQVNSRIDKFITRFFLFLAFNNIVDELFFDPTAFSINEYLTVLLFIIYNLFRQWKR